MRLRLVSLSVSDCFYEARRSLASIRARRLLSCLRRAGGVFFLLCLVGFVVVGCKPSDADFEGESLSPYENGFGPRDTLFEPQPRREKPRAMALSLDKNRLFIALQGTVDAPGHAVLAVDLETRSVVKRYAVGPYPTGLALHPDGRLLVVTTPHANHLSVIDLKEHKVRRLEADYYTSMAAFSPDGRRLYLTNRWRDTLQAWDVRADGGSLDVRSRQLTPDIHGVPVGSNPQDLLVSDDGQRVFVASITGLTVSVIDTSSLRELDLDADPETTDAAAPAGITRLHVGAPSNGLTAVGGRLYIATLSASTHHPALEGPDTNGDGTPGDGTPNMGFQDLQNEIAVFDLQTLAPQVRYTSDTLCCFDYRDVSPDDPLLGALLPDPSLWIVGGALPERIGAYQVEGDAAKVVVVYSGSNEAQRFEVLTDGSLTPGPKVQTGFNPSGLVLNPERGEAYVSNRLGESITFIDLNGFTVSETVVVGDVEGGEFPATDAEIGEFFYFAGAAFSVDGDQTCNHCHRDRGNINKAFSMPLLADPRGSRMTPDSRFLFETRPWFLEGAMDENNFFPVINEFARRENFCCSDPEYSELTDCAITPPAACADRGWPRSAATRDQFFSEVSQQTLGRVRSVGAVIDTRLDYLGTTRLLGLFLLQNPAALPNPNSGETPDARRGRQIFNSPSTGCATCHPAPAFTTTFEPSALDIPLHFGPLISPNVDENGQNLDLAHEGFLQTFPLSRQGTDDIRLNPPSLVGLWDRAPSLLHDGRAHGLREALCTPGHPALLAGERGYNETGGIMDTHGATSHLTPGDVADLIAYLLTL